MNEETVVQSNIQILQGTAATDFEVRWQILSQRLPQFVSDCNSERIITIGPSLPKLSQNDCVGFFDTWCRINPWPAEVESRFSSVDGSSLVGSLELSNYHVIIMRNWHA